MICKNCGASLPPDSNFCIYCGAEINNANAPFEPAQHGSSAPYYAPKNRTNKAPLIIAAGIVAAVLVCGIVGFFAVRHIFAQAEQDDVNGSNSNAVQTEISENSKETLTQEYETKYLISKGTTYDTNGNSAPAFESTYDNEGNPLSSKTYSTLQDDTDDTNSFVVTLAGETEFEYDDLDNISILRWYYYMPPLVVGASYFSHYEQDFTDFLYSAAWDPYSSCLDGYCHLLFSKERSDKDTLHGWIEYTYDSQGNKVTAKSYDEEGASDGWLEYTYDSTGNISSTKHYTGNGELDRWCEHIYDSTGNLVEHTNYCADGSLEDQTKYTYEYTSENKLIVEHYDSSNSLDKKLEYTFDDSGNPTSEKFYLNISWGESPDSVILYTYDENNNLIRADYQDEDGELEGYYLYEYTSIQVPVEDTKD